MGKKKKAKFDLERFHLMLGEMRPHLDQILAIRDRYYPDGEGLPYWTEILDDDPDADLGIGGDDSCNDVWSFLTNGIHSFP